MMDELKMLHMQRQWLVVRHQALMMQSEHRSTRMLDEQLTKSCPGHDCLLPLNLGSRSEVERLLLFSVAEPHFHVPEAR